MVITMCTPSVRIARGSNLVGYSVVYAGQTETLVTRRLRPLVVDFGFRSQMIIMIDSRIHSVRR